MLRSPQDREIGRLAVPALGGALALGCLLLADPLVQRRGETADAAARYLRISAAGVPPALIALAGQGYLRGVGALRTPLAIVVAAQAVNALLERRRAGARGARCWRRCCGSRASCSCGRRRCCSRSPRGAASPRGSARRRWAPTRSRWACSSHGASCSRSTGCSSAPGDTRCLAASMLLGGVGVYAPLALLALAQDWG